MAARTRRERSGCVLLGRPKLEQNDTVPSSKHGPALVLEIFSQASSISRTFCGAHCAKFSYLFSANTQTRQPGKILMDNSFAHAFQRVRSTRQHSVYDGIQGYDSAGRLYIAVFVPAPGVGRVLSDLLRCPGGMNPYAPTHPWECSIWPLFQFVLFCSR
jgi:hypothetical protein